MRSLFLPLPACIILLTAPVIALPTTQAQLPPERGLTEVHHSQVDLQGGFWGPRLKTAHETTVPHALDHLEKNGHITNFDLAAGNFDGSLRGHHAFDSDIHKAMEGAMYSLGHNDDPELMQRVDSIVDRILAAQQDDGFLISYFIVNGLDIRWDDMRKQHQMYNAGHFFEMAVEHERLTGDDKALEAAKRFADHIDDTFGPGKIYDVGGHEEIELALIKLYRATGENRYLDLCRFLLDERGHLHGDSRKPFTPGSLVMPEREEGQSDEDFRRAQRFARIRWRNGRMQDHKPLVDQHEATGHAVRAGYIYSAMADIARFSDAPAYGTACDHLWDDVVSRKMYVNGAVGTAQYGDEGYGDPYLLPNRTYCESCASIAHVLWQHRMNLLKGEAKYADVMELALYNAVLAGIDISGDGFFYQNPLESHNGGQRSTWIGLACCPTNLTRIIPQVGGMVYAQDGDKIYVNLFASGTGTFELPDGTKVTLTQKTNYPWDGKVEIAVDVEEATEFELCARIPGWAERHAVPSDLYSYESTEIPRYDLVLNRGEQFVGWKLDDGYYRIRRQWKPGDRLSLSFPMPVRRVIAHENIEADRGKVCLKRGPIVYCLEAVDNPDVDVLNVSLPKDAAFKTTHRDDLLGGVTVIETTGIDADGKEVPLIAVPYYAWANRERGPMTVWINQAE